MKAFFSRHKNRRPNICRGGGEAFQDQQRIAVPESYIMAGKARQLFEERRQDIFAYFPQQRDADYTVKNKVATNSARAHTHLHTYKYTHPHTTNTHTHTPPHTHTPTPTHPQNTHLTFYFAVFGCCQQSLRSVTNTRQKDRIINRGLKVKGKCHSVTAM